MADVLMYWRDYAANWVRQFADDRAFYWHSSAKCIAELQPGDRMWMVTSGKGLRDDAEQAAFLVGVWAVREVIDNLDDDQTVIEPLANEGADIRVDVSIIAKGDAAIRENTVELGIKESLAQRGIVAEVDAR